MHTLRLNTTVSRTVCGTRSTGRFSDRRLYSKHVTDAGERLSAAALFVLAPLAVITTRFTWGNDVPDPLPTHWSGQGQVDGTTSATVFFVIFLSVTTALTAVGAISALRRAIDRSYSLLAGTAFGTWMFAAIYMQILSAARGAVDADDVHLRWQAVIPMLTVGATAAVIAMLLLPRAAIVAGRPQPATADDHSVDSGDADTETTRSSIAELIVLAAARVAETVTTILSKTRINHTIQDPIPAAADASPGAAACWVGSARSGFIRASAAVLGAATVGVSLVSWGAALALFAACLAATWMHLVTVRIDENGVQILWGPTGRPRKALAVGQIASVHAESSVPAVWKRPVHRGSRYRNASAVRAGQGIVIERRTRAPYVVAVNDADEAVLVLERVLAKQHH